MEYVGCDCLTRPFTPYANYPNVVVSDPHGFIAQVPLTTGLARKTLERDIVIFELERTRVPVDRKESACHAILYLHITI